MTDNVWEKLKGHLKSIWNSAEVASYYDFGPADGGLQEREKTINGYRACGPGGCPY